MRPWGMDASSLGLGGLRRTVSSGPTGLRCPALSTTFSAPQMTLEVIVSAAADGPASPPMMAGAQTVEYAARLVRAQRHGFVDRYLRMVGGGTIKLRVRGAVSGSNKELRNRALPPHRFSPSMNGFRIAGAFCARRCSAPCVRRTTII